MTEHVESRMQAATAPEEGSPREVDRAELSARAVPGARTAAVAEAAVVEVAASAALETTSESVPPSRAQAPLVPLPSFGEIYEQHFAFVWRTLRRYGVPEGALDDATQDVFVVVHGQLAGFEGRSTLKTWLFGIARRVARNHRPSGRSVNMDSEHLELVGGKAQGTNGRPGASVEAAELLRLLLDKLAPDKRDAFILMELEEMTIAEAADALGVNRNTIYSRLRSARLELEQAVSRIDSQERSVSWRS